MYAQILTVRCRDCTRQEVTDRKSLEDWGWCEIDDDLWLCPNHIPEQMPGSYFKPGFRAVTPGDPEPTGQVPPQDPAPEPATGEPPADPEPEPRG